MNETSSKANAAAGLMDLIREAYMRQYRESTGKHSYGRTTIARWDGGTDSFGRRFTNVWAKVAEFALTNGVDPIRLIRAMFDQYRGHRPPMPNQLYGQVALKIYHAHTATREEDLRHSLASQISSLKTRYQELCRRRKLPPDKAVSYALTDPNLNFSPLFCYCIATSQNLPLIRDFYYEAALQQYQHLRHIYDVAWDGLIPDELKAAAEARHLELLKDIKTIYGQN